jgi:addiction module RelE/StbE family toxin
MTLAYSKNFIKQAKKLQVPTKKLQERIALFVDNPLDPQLRNHALSGKYKDYRSIDVTGDIRAIYITTSSETIFEHIGTHSQLYG